MRIQKSGPATSVMCEDYVPEDTAGAYDRSRASMPSDLAAMLVTMAGAAIPHVVDLGAGTGLSCTMWRGRPCRVTAIEPDARYRDLLARRFATELDTGQFIMTAGTAERSELPDRCADIVTACGSLHWFDLDEALAEVARILRPGGIFAVCNANSTPLVADWKMDRALRETVKRIKSANQLFGSGHASDGWIGEQVGKLKLLQQTGHFHDVREIQMHSTEEGDGKRILELAGTLGAYRLLKHGADEKDLGLPQLRQAVAQQTEPHPWWWSFQIVLALR